MLIVVRKRGEKLMCERVVGELLDVCNNIGVVVKKREDIYKMVEVNKVFVYYRY